MDTSKSEFFHFGLLPEVTIYSPIEDQYSKMYVPRHKCDCGSSKWINGKMDILNLSMGRIFPQKDVHRCKNCNEVRMADHLGVKDEVTN